MTETTNEKFEIIAKLFAKMMFYNDWQWENPNERVITMLMKDVGLYPFKNEDEMIAKTKVDEALYRKANIEIMSRPLINLFTDNETKMTENENH